ncbi:hypothetical protein Tco_0687601 [Tanacetum coccineum]
MKLNTPYPEDLSIYEEYLVNISKRRTFWSLNEDILKITILKKNTPYPSRKIRRIRACTHQRPQRKEDQYAGRYGYLFAHLKKRFMPRTSSDQLADNIHDVMMETLPSLVKEKVTEQVKKEVPAQVRDQVPVYLAKGLILERKTTT